ncbi:hypothetical protein HAX54_011917 [Datura stramonium]|uniref:Calmodulin binding protein central domain-containing protein n=1 Tax=Datura stramonium TaxID=4076 RepID=A0ABS8TIX7_DATST|nr:hypothetical protein [Datura stramonium]
MVKDHTELYKKHYPPALGDDVWRLEKIGKDGTFHRKLTSQGVKTGYIENLVRMPSGNWSSLEEVDGGLVNEPALLSPGEPGGHHHLNAYPRSAHLSAAGGSEQAVEYSEWIVNPAHICLPVENGVRYISESSSEGELHYL